MWYFSLTVSIPFGFFNFLQSLLFLDVKSLRGTAAAWKLSYILKCTEKCARRDWSEQVPCISTNHAPYVTRVHC